MLYQKNINFLLGQNRKKIPYMVFLFFLSSSFDIIGLGLIAPYITIVLSPDNILIDNLYIFSFYDFSNISSKDLIIFSSIILVAVFLVKTVIAVFINWRIFKFILDTRASLQIKLAEMYLNLSYSEYLKKSSADAIDNIQMLVERSCNAIQAVFRTISEIVTILFISCFLIYTNILAFSSLILLIGTVSFIYYVLFTSRSKKYGELSSVANRDLLKHFQESSLGYKHLHIFGGKNFFLERIGSAAQKLSSYALKVSIISSSPRYVIEFVLILFIVILILVSLINANSSLILITNLSIFGLAAVRILPSANNILNNLSQIKFGNFAINELSGELISSINDNKHIIDHSNQYSINDFKELLISDLFFTHSDTKQASLNNINLKIKKGESIGLYGPSGSGKTTFVDILMGFINPQKGSIEINGYLLEECLTSWRSKIAYLPQETFIIDASIKENITLGEGKEKYNELKLKQSLEMSMLSEYIESLPQGINTIVGERGARISGGQKQRIAIARAFYFDRDFLILDESTSALDKESEEVILKVINKMKKLKTFILISHRSTTLESCDRLIEIKSGQLVE
tara:strand:+ start:21349 stop:23070 length:1722 start_codon:yes stop_codon:yes gene_type:complete